MKVIRCVREDKPMKFKKLIITSCMLLGLGVSGFSWAQIHCPESITCSSDSATSCKSPDSSWQGAPPVGTVKQGDTFNFIYAFYSDGMAKCGYKRSDDNSITLSLESTRFVPAKQSAGWPPVAIAGGAQTCGGPSDPSAATSCSWQTK